MRNYNPSDDELIRLVRRAASARSALCTRASTTRSESLRREVERPACNGHLRGR